MAKTNNNANKFVSVNLNKSYVPQQRHHHHLLSSDNPNRITRPGSGGGGGGMVVLSRQQKTAVPKLSVPPPLNLPSLRKENERFDSSGVSATGAGGRASLARPGSGGTRPAPSSSGWGKPATSIATTERDEHSNNTSNSGGNFGDNINSASGVLSGGVSGSNNSISNVYVPPSARSIGGVGEGYTTSTQVFEKAAVLRGEDFPSLHATLSAVSDVGSKLKNGLGNQKQKKQVVSEELGNRQRDRHGSPVRSSALVDMRPPLQSKGDAVRNDLVVNGGARHRFGGGSAAGKVQKREELLSGPLPLVQLNHRSDWEDDERETGLGHRDRGRDHGFTKSEAYHERDFDFPRRSGVLPHKLVHHPFDKQRQHDNETGKVPSSSEVTKVESHGRDVRTPSREGWERTSWRASSPLSKDGFSSQDFQNYRNNPGARPPSQHRETVKENKYAVSPVRDNSWDDVQKRDVSYTHGGRLPWTNTVDKFGNRGHFGNEQYNRYRGDSYRNGSAAKSSFALSGEGVTVNDPILNFGREKKSFAKSENTYMEDPFWGNDFDGRDPFQIGLVGLVKKKKEVLKQTEFHDPVRESFEAELERVQKIQEQERQRIIEEQERAMEQIRREEDERMQLALEQKERQRRLEEEAREAVWRAEQERLEATRRAEEQRIAREEEKQRIIMEEERRKQAAMQKLLELEEKMAKRKAEVTESDGQISVMAAEKEISKEADPGDWEDNERMVDRITTSSDSSGMSRPFEMGSRSHFSRDDPFSFLDRGKHVNSWKRDKFESGSSSSFVQRDQGRGHSSTWRDTSAVGRAFSRKEFYGGSAFISSRSYHRGGIPESHIDDLSQIEGQRWNVSGGDHFSRNLNTESEYHENLAERFGDAGLGQGHTRSSSYPTFHERMYQNPEVDGEPSLFGRSRYSTRQPRVLPPPSMTGMHRGIYRGENQHPGRASFIEGEMRYIHGGRDDSTGQMRYDSSHQENVGHAEMFGTQQNTTESELRNLERKTEGCDSQSSLSVSSPPDSPAHLSHDDLDDFGDRSVLSAVEGKSVIFSGQQSEAVTLPVDAQKESGSSAVSTGDIEEWIIQNDEQLQEQEGYDDDEDGYEEEDEGNDVEDDISNVAQEFGDLHIEEKCSNDMVENLVLGFNEGVEVGMLNDEFEKSSRNEEIKYAVEEQGSFDGLCHDVAVQPKSAAHSSLATELMNPIDVSGSLLSADPQLPSSSVETMASSVPAVSQPEAVQLQFGLFSGPSLIPPAVPAIQIGSIQMPLHLYPPIGSSLAHTLPSQPPLYQFGQPRYTSPISQGVLPLPPRSMSFVRPSVPIRTGRESSAYNLREGFTHNFIPVAADNQRSLLLKNSDPSHGVVSIEGTSLPPKENTDKSLKIQQGIRDNPHTGDGILRLDSGLQSNDSLVRNFQKLPAGALEMQPQTAVALTQTVLEEKSLGLPEAPAPAPASVSRGKRHIFSVKSSAPGPFHTPESSSSDLSRVYRKPRRQRTEFRVRDNFEKRQPTGMVPSNSNGVEDKSIISGRVTGARSGTRRVVMSSRQPKQTFESESLSSKPMGSQHMDSMSRTEKGAGKESLRKGQYFPRPGEEFDTSLQSGVVRIFEQPGIEAPSDDDDFIEVRSKRQMLNDRREQKEKEIKAKSRASKMPRKSRSTPQSSFPSITSSKNSESLVGVSSSSRFVSAASETNIERYAGSSAPMVSQPLPPIGNPAVKTDVQDDLRSLQTNSIIVSGGEKNLSSGSTCESNSKVSDNVHTSLGSWGNSQINQQAVDPSQLELLSSVRGPNNPLGDPSLQSSSVMNKDTSLSSASSPINSLLAGEKIQFGAVISPPILHSSSCSVSHGNGPPGPCQADVQISHNLSAVETDCSLFLDDNKKNESHLEDCEAEARAAASAVAAISSDEIVGNGVDAVSVSVVDAKSFGVSDVNYITAGGDSGIQQSSLQPRGEESISVALPADLSVETPPISLWPPSPSPQNSSSQLLPHVPGAPASHFPFYEMNPLLGGPIFAFGPQDESASNQSSTQKTNASVLGPIGSWQPHSGVDSFYGPTAGFPGPYISTPGSIPAVQGPPHMVVYNHFAPVGLSFMGATYIPSGKQPDWKHNPASSGASSAEGDMNTSNVVSAQRTPANMPAPVQHLAPGSPLVPVASPLPMFDVSPFQSNPDVSVQGRWQHVPVSMPMQQQAGGLQPPFDQTHSVDHSFTANRFTIANTSTPSSDTHKFPEATIESIPHLPDELGLVDPSSSSTRETSVSGFVAKSSSTSEISDSGKTKATQSTSSGFKTQTSHHKKSASAQQFHSSSGPNHPKNGSGGEWSHRRLGYQGRNQNPSKMKQIYVAKQASGTSQTAS